MLDKVLLQDMIAQRYVSVQKHPDADLFIHNYGPTVQFERKWNSVTMACRGLILDKSGNVVARPFEKFFNFEEHDSPFLDDIPTDESFDVFTKYDGSLGILYWIDDDPFISTRGAFFSDQAVKATKMLKGQYANSIPHLKRDQTYLFEIIFPSNRIVVDYGQREELVLLAIIDNETGKDLPLEDIGFPLVERHDGVKDLVVLTDLKWDNREGFVVRFSGGLRVKLKFEEYKRLHRIVTNVSTKSIWEMLRANQPLDEILDRVPDEFYQWVQDTRDSLENRFKEIKNDCGIDFGNRPKIDDRKTVALFFKTCKHPAILFTMLDKRTYDDIIWKMLRPDYEKPFKKVVE